MSQKLVDRYIEIARALKPLKQNGRAFHLTAIFDKRKVLSIGVNSYLKSHPSRKFGVYSSKNDGEYNPKCHSEIHSLLKLGECDCSNYTFLNIRLTKDGKPALAKPCHNCFSVLKNQVGFKRIIYTTEDAFEVITNC